MDTSRRILLHARGQTIIYPPHAACVAVHLDPTSILPSSSAYSMSNETYLPPTFAIAWTPIRISGTSRMMAMGNRKTTARVGPSITPRRCTSMRALSSF